MSIGDVFVIAGQSNAFGFGKQAYSPLKDIPYTPSMYSQDGVETWEPLRDTPLNGQPRGSPWPYAMSYLSKKHKLPVGIINVASAGSWISQWQKSSDDKYESLLGTVAAATRGTMRVRAVLWFQGEADCSPSEQYSTVSHKGDYSGYLADLKQLVSDLHNDLILDTVYIGIIGNVPHRIEGVELSTRQNILNIRKALADSWKDRSRVSPGPMTYDIALNSDPTHIHFSAPNEMIPFARRWAAAIGATTYGVGVGRGPILQQVTVVDGKTVQLAFDRALKISDFNGRSGPKALGWYLESESKSLPESIISKTELENNVVYVKFKRAVPSDLTVSYGVDSDAAGKPILRGQTDLPVEPFYHVPIGDLKQMPLPNKRSNKK